MLLQAAREARGEETVKGPVMNSDELRTALAESLGEEVPSKELFPLLQLADPDSEGVITLPRFLEVVEMRKRQMEKEREQATLLAAYVALGGNSDKDRSIKSEWLTAIASDFVGSTATKAAMTGVVKHKMKAVQEVLDMGGTLDSDEEEELRDTSTLAFEELEAYAHSLQEHGADHHNETVSDAAGGALLR